jgi:hypothetical protein
MKMLAQRGFTHGFLLLLRSLQDKGSIGVRINDVNSDYFEARRGVRQGDPISPVLFNFVADVFTRMLLKAADR